VTETHHTFCRICESLCGLEVDVEGGRIVEIRPDREHVATGGFACVKGLKQHELFQSPDRLEFPLKRVGETFHRVSWEQALEEIGATVKRLRGECGADSIAMYVGTAAGFSLLHPIFAQGFMTGIGSRSMYASATQDCSSATQDCSNKFAVARELYGFPFTQPFPDLDHTSCLIIVGANPVVSKWSFLQVPNPVKRLREITGRGGKLYVVDPRRTETAKAAGAHVFIRPGTDVFFYLAFLHELIGQGGVDRPRVDAHMKGFAEIEALVRPWTPERAETVTRIPAATLRQMVRDYREADGAALYSSTGVNMGGNGALAFWIQEVINAVSGNLDRRGGTLVGQGILDFGKLGRRSGFGLSTQTSRIGGFTAVNDAFPGGVLADEILTPGERQVRALFCTGGNPLLSMANGAKLREAFVRAARHDAARTLRPSLRVSASHGHAVTALSPGHAAGGATGWRATRRGDHLSGPRARERSTALRLEAATGDPRARLFAPLASQPGRPAFGAPGAPALAAAEADRKRELREAPPGAARPSAPAPRGRELPRRERRGWCRAARPRPPAAARAGSEARGRLRDRGREPRSPQADHAAPRQDPQHLDPQPSRLRVCSPISSPAPVPFPTAGATRRPPVSASRARRPV
jgi:hypothetical protein